MGQDLDRLALLFGVPGRGDERSAVLADRSTDRDILLGDAAGAFERGIEAPLRCRRFGQGRGAARRLPSAD